MFHSMRLQHCAVVTYNSRRHAKSKKDFSTAILEKKKAPNRLIVEDAGGWPGDLWVWVRWKV